MASILKRYYSLCPPIYRPHRHERGLLLQMSHVLWSVSVCVGHTGEPRKTDDRSDRADMAGRHVGRLCWPPRHKPLQLIALTIALTTGWLTSLMNVHITHTKYDEQTSALQTISASTIQGSAIGPALVCCRRVWFAGRYEWKCYLVTARHVRTDLSAAEIKKSSEIMTLLGTS